MAYQLPDDPLARTRLIEQYMFNRPAYNQLVAMSATNPELKELRQAVDAARQSQGMMGWPTRAAIATPTGFTPQYDGQPIPGERALVPLNEQLPYAQSGGGGGGRAPTPPIPGGTTPSFADQMRMMDQAQAGQPLPFPASGPRQYQPIPWDQLPEHIKAAQSGRAQQPPINSQYGAPYGGARPPASPGQPQYDGQRFPTESQQLAAAGGMPERPIGQQPIGQQPIGQQPGQPANPMGNYQDAINAAANRLQEQANKASKVGQTINPNGPLGQKTNNGPKSPTGQSPGKKPPANQPRQRPSAGGGGGAKYKPTPEQRAREEGRYQNALNKAKDKNARSADRRAMEQLAKDKGYNNVADMQRAEAFEDYLNKNKQKQNPNQQPTPMGPDPLGNLPLGPKGPSNPSGKDPLRTPNGRLPQMTDPMGRPLDPRTGKPFDPDDPENPDNLGQKRRVIYMEGIGFRTVG